MLEIGNLHVEIDVNPILKALSLAVNADEVHAIMGPDGAGVICENGELKMSMAQVLRLKPAFSNEQAQALVGLFDEELATKADIEKLRLELGADIQKLRLELGADLQRTGLEFKAGDDSLRAEIERFRVEVQRDLKATEARLVTWVVGQGRGDDRHPLRLLHFLGSDVLHIDTLYAEMDGMPILKGLSLAVNAGEVRVIMLPNGAGKSMLGGARRSR